MLDSEAAEYETRTLSSLLASSGLMDAILGPDDEVLTTCSRASVVYVCCCPLPALLLQVVLLCAPPLVRTCGTEG